MTTALACSASTSTSWTKASGLKPAEVERERDTHITSTPIPSSSSALYRCVVSTGGWLPGRTTSLGCGSKVTTTAG